MPFKPGHPKMGGRPKGSLNRVNQDLREKAERLGVDPLEVLFLIANGDQEALKTENPVTLDQRLRAASEAAQYLHAKRRATELSGPNGEPIDHIIQAAQEFQKMDREALIRIVEEELGKLKGEK